MLQDIKQFAIENSPQIKKISVEGVAGGAAWGYTLNEWVAIVTITYILMQMAYLVWK